MKLLILRHAATEPHTQHRNDFDRRLTNEGRDRCYVLPKAFEALRIETVWCSSSVRTKETATLVLNNMQPKPAFLDEMYLATNDDLLQKIWHDAPDGDLFLIGHNPGISYLATYSTGDAIALSTGELICIEFDIKSWNELTQESGIIVDLDHL